MRYGTVVQYFPAKGFGFIRPDSGRDVFFHVTALGACEMQPQIEPGQAVKFELERPDGNATRPKGSANPQAMLVELIDRIPGAVLDDTAQKQQMARHPRARKQKPRWRR